MGPIAHCLSGRPGPRGSDLRGSQGLDLSLGRKKNAENGRSHLKHPAALVWKTRLKRDFSFAFFLTMERPKA